MVPDLERLSAVTREYARFSRSAAGLGSVLGGVLGLVSYFAGALAPLTWWSRAALAALPLVWIVAKELLQRLYYQRHGRVEEVERAGERRLHRFLTATVAAVSIAVVGWALRDAIVHGPGARAWWELAATSRSWWRCRSSCGGI